MKNLSENKMICRAKELCRRLSELRIKKECDLTLSIYDAKNPEKAECTHNLKSSSDQSLIKLLSIVGLLCVMLSAIRCICSFFKD